MKGFKFRLEPNETQKKQIQETLDSARFVYNRFLDLNEYAYQTEGIHLSYAMMCSLLTDLKQDPEYPWLKQADSMALQTALKDLDEAFQNFFAGRAKYPKFKTKKRSLPDVQSIQSSRQRSALISFHIVHAIRMAAFRLLISTM